MELPNNLYLPFDHNKTKLTGYYVLAIPIVFEPYLTRHSYFICLLFCDSKNVFAWVDITNILIFYNELDVVRNYQHWGNLGQHCLTSKQARMLSFLLRYINLNKLFQKTMRVTSPNCWEKLRRNWPPQKFYADGNEQEIVARGVHSPHRPNFTVWKIGKQNNVHEMAKQFKNLSTVRNN